MKSDTKKLIPNREGYWIWRFNKKNYRFLVCNVGVKGCKEYLRVYHNGSYYDVDGEWPNGRWVQYDGKYNFI